MPRCQRCRRVCDMPKHSFFQNTQATNNTINLTVDEYEVIRLVDYLKFTHAECANRMNISRTTVTEIYESARFKISKMLVEGNNLSISGGNYHLCAGYAIESCGNEGCKSSNQHILKKGERIMRVR